MANNEQPGGEETGQSSLVKEKVQPPSIATSGSALQLGNRWFSQLLVIATGSQFTGQNIQAVLQPRKLHNHLIEMVPPGMDPTCKKMDC